jgi:hypothetical protein
MGQLSDAGRAKVLGLNAARLFAFDARSREQLAAVAGCIDTEADAVGLEPRGARGPEAPFTETRADRGGIRPVYAVPTR